MKQETNLLHAVLALQMNFITREQLVECGALWASDRSESILKVFERKGYLTPDAKSALEALVKAQVKKSGGPEESFASLNLDEGVKGSLLLLPLDGEIRSSLMASAPAKDGAPSEPPSAPGRGGDRYKLKGEIGRGGIGRVVAATDTVLGREVAIKEMLEVSDPELVRRFMKEGEIAGRLSHPNVIPVHDIGVRDDPGRIPGGPGRRVPYFVMTRIEGRNLKEIIRAAERGRWESAECPVSSVEKLKQEARTEHSTPNAPHSPSGAITDPRREFSRPRLLRIFQDVCLAVASAHHHGVIHRDLKPANVMVGSFGEVYVVDWGLAKVLRARDSARPDSPDPPSPADGDARASAETGSPGSNTLDSTRTDTAVGLNVLRDSNQAGPAGRAPAGGLENGALREPTSITVEGYIIGTPSYMPPEQADGRVLDVDERSDVYSLGAMLYEILSCRPPFEGETGINVIAKVLSGSLTPPSARVSELRRAKETQVDWDYPIPVPQELDAIVLKAMAFRKPDRYPRVMDIFEDVQKYLEREKELEQRRSQARVLHQKALEARNSASSLIREIEGARIRLEKSNAGLQAFWPAHMKAECWRLEDDLKRLEDEALKAVESVEREFWRALTFEHDNEEVLRDFLDFCWEMFLAAEEKEDRKEIVHFRGIVETLDAQGRFTDRLVGDGTLAVSARQYRCRCLLEGRWVSPDELAGSVECGVSGVEKQKAPSEHSALDTLHSSCSGMTGYHPMSGRRLGGSEGARGRPDLEPREMLLLKAHGSSCRTAALEGADVWLFRFDERDRMLLPVMPRGISAGVECRVSSVEKKERGDDRRDQEPPGGEARRDSGVAADDRFPPGQTPEQLLNTLHSTLDALYDLGSPFRPTEGLYLGRTPVRHLKIPMGSYLLIVAKEGYSPVRVPVMIGRNAREEVSLTIFRDGEVPEGFVQVPAGRFVYQGDKANPTSVPKQVAETSDFFLAGFPVTCREYLEFLNALSADRPEEAARRVPRSAEKTGHYWPKDSDGKYAVPTVEWLATAGEKHRKGTRRLGESPVEWEEDWPVMGISWDDAMTYAAWFTQNRRVLASLPTEVMWEKSARGADRRLYPFGNQLDYSFMNAARSHEGKCRPCPVDSFPTDESPFGARGLCGNASDWCMDEVQNGALRLIRGGAWFVTGYLTKSTTRYAYPPASVEQNYGFRLCVLPSTCAG